MDFDDAVCLHCLDVDRIVEDAQLAVQASAKTVRRMAAMLTEQEDIGVGRMLRRWRGQRSDVTQLLSEVDQLLKNLDAHERELAVLALALFNPGDPKQYH